MLQVNQLDGFGVGGAVKKEATFAVTGIYVGSTGSSATITFPSLDFGDEDSDRVIVVAFGGSFTGTPTVASISIGGVAATLLGTTLTNSGRSYRMAFAVVPSGVSGDVVVTLTAAATSTRTLCGCWRLTGYELVNSDYSGATAAAGTGARSVACSVPSGGVQLILAGLSASNTSSWSGAVKSGSVLNGTAIQCETGEFSPGAGASNSVTVTPSASASSAMMAVSFALAA